MLGNRPDSDSSPSQGAENLPIATAIFPNIGKPSRQQRRYLPTLGRVAGEKSSISQDWDTYYLRRSTFSIGGKHKSQQKQISPLKGTYEYPQNKFPPLKGEPRNG